LQNGLRSSPLAAALKAPALIAPAPKHAARDRCPSSAATLHKEAPAGVTVSAMAEIGSLVGDPARMNMLVALSQYGEATAGQLAAFAGVSSPTASGHIAKLVCAGLVVVERVGRRHLHRLGSEHVSFLLHALQLAGALARPASGRPRSASEIGQDVVRQCRTHLGGRLAVSLTDVLLTSDGDRCELHEAGRTALARWGLDVGSVERVGRCTCGLCMDWSEGRPHVGGALGAAIRDRSISLGWIRTRPDRRTVTLTPAGLLGFHARFGIDATTW
jgi:DNA-binding transcriptional ArsR family regulator